MKILLYSRSYSIYKQYFLSITLIVIVSIICYLLKNYFEYKVVAVILLFVVSVLAMIFDILPVLLAAVLSALILNYFFIPPFFTLHIKSTEDILLFFIYLSVALVNAVLSFKIRKEEEKNRDKEEKEKSIKLYNTLLNSLSHELRTPITSIIGAVDTLKENKEKLTLIQNDHLLNEIDLASQRLNRQVGNLLNMSRLETGMLKLKKDWVDTNELIFSVIQKFSQIKTHKIEYSSDDKLPLLKYDGILMGQVLFNLIHNAILYTPEFSIIKIVADYKDNFCHILVSDDGNGFPEKEIENVFHKFYRLENTKTGGSGLGLSIAKGYVEAHKGVISLKNNDEGGAEFLITFPAEASYINILKNE